MIPLADEPIMNAKPATSTGERVFDWVTYGGIATLGTFIATIPVAYASRYGGESWIGRKLNQWHDRGMESLIAKGFSPTTASDIALTTATMQGGNITVIPVKWMENIKPAFVKKINDLVGDKSGNISVDEEPQQTWGSLIKARMLAWVTAFTGFSAASKLFPNSFKAFQNEFAENVVCKPLKKPTHTVAPKLLPADPKLKEALETTHFRVGKMAAIDLFATIAASALLYIGSRFFAMRNRKWDTDHSEEKKAATPETKNAPADLLDQTPSETAKRFVSAIAPSSNFTDAVAASKQTSADHSLSA